MRSNLAKAKLHLLSSREVQTAGEGDHADGGGLLLRVRAQSASWVLRYTASTGRRREMGLGVARRASAAQAGDSLSSTRDLAHAARELLRRSIDPIDNRHLKRGADRENMSAKKAEKVREQLTLARAARAYHERVVEPRMTAKHSAQWIASLEQHVSRVIWHKPIAEIEAPELLAALSRVRSLEDPAVRVPETLSRVRQRLDAVFEDAIFHGFCTTNPAAAVRRKMREVMPKKKATGFAALDYREAPAFLQRLRDAQGTAARCLEFAVLSASRTGEAIGAVWPEFDLASRTWIVPPERMKASGKDRPEPHVVHLSEQALAVLRGQLGIHERIVFPSAAREGEAMSNMAMLTVLSRLGARNRTTVHGLCRATFSTWAYETAAARPEVIEACLAHREADKVKAAYNRAKFSDERRALLAAWSTYLSQASRVIPMWA